MQHYPWLWYFLSGSTLIHSSIGPHELLRTFLKGVLHLRHKAVVQQADPGLLFEPNIRQEYKVAFMWDNFIVGYIYGQTSCQIVSAIGHQLKLELLAKLLTLIHISVIADETVLCPLRALKCYVCMLSYWCFGDPKRVLHCPKMVNLLGKGRGYISILEHRSTNAFFH